MKLLANLLYDTAFGLKTPGKIYLFIIFTNLTFSYVTAYVVVNFVLTLSFLLLFNWLNAGSSTKLLEQKIPATYLALEDLTGQLATELRVQGNDPVLNHEQYESAVNRELMSKFGLRFRDGAELNQATKFLHENGLLLHYEDSTLRDLYFLDPQWLCGKKSLSCVEMNDSQKCYAFLQYLLKCSNSFRYAVSRCHNP